MSDTINPFSPVRHTAQVRTYGRRHKTPEADDSVPSLFRSTAAGSLTDQSPCSKLLGKFQGSSLSFLGGLSKIGVSSDGADEDDNDEDDAPTLSAREIEEQLKRMRGKQTAAPSSMADGVTPKRPETAPAKVIDASAKGDTLAVRNILHRSSSLTEAPSSFLPSSPPSRLLQQPSSPTRLPSQPPVPFVTEAAEEETLAVRGPGFKKGKRTQIMPLEEEAEDSDHGGELPREAAGSQSRSPSGTPIPAITSTTRRPRTRSTTPDSPILNLGSRRNKTQQARRIPSSTPKSASDSESEENDDEDEARSSGTETGKVSAAVAGSGKDAFFADLARQTERDEEAEEEEAEREASKRAPSKVRSESIEDPELDGAGPSKPRKERALNQKDRLQLQKDIAEAQRTDHIAKLYTTSRPEPKETFPLSAFFLDVKQVIRARDEDEHNVSGRDPGMMQGGSSPASSAFHKTPPDDPIEPYSSPRNLANEPKPTKLTFDPKPTIIGQGPGIDRNRRPTPQGQLKLSNRTTKSAEPVDPAVQARWAEARARIKQLDLKKEIRRPSSDVVEDDSDLEIEPPVPVPKAAPPAKKKGPDARAVLFHTAKGEGKQLTRAEQANLARAGRSVRVQQTFTETYAAHAGKAFGHHNERNSNGGANPAGQKKGRDMRINDKQLYADLAEKALRKALTVRTEKESMYGKGRVMPERQELDMAQLEEAARRRQDVVQEEEDDEDDDEYVGSGEEGSGSEAEGDEDKENEEPYSGEEQDEGEDEEADPGSEAEDVLIAATSSGPALDVALDEQSIHTSASQRDEIESPIRTMKKSRKSRVVLESDDEDEHLMARSPLAEINVQVVTTASDGAPSSVPKSAATSSEKEASSGGLAPPVQLGFGEFDVGGFGDDAGGFSQLFDETQLNTVPSDQAGEAGKNDAFAAMRATPKGFFVAHAALPDNHISDTQKERDAALVAGEGADEDRALEDVPKQKYLNEAGLYTQNKPATMRGPLAGLSTDSIFGLSGPSDGNSPLGNASPSRSASPTSRSADTPGLPEPTAINDDDNEEEEFAPLTRLKRRKSPVILADSDGEGADADQSDTEEDAPAEAPSPTQMSALGGGDDVSYPSGTKKNAFQKMMAAEKERRLGPAPKDPYARRKLGKSDLVDEQAEESDEDGGWGPTERGPDDDEDGGEGDDGYVEGLVDDEAVDEATKKEQDRLAEEKMREVEKADDAKREAEARKVAAGEGRTKRRGKDFFSDEDDDENQPKRHKLDKKRRKKMREMRKNDIDLYGDENIEAFQQNYENDSSDEDEDVLGQDNDLVPTYSLEDESMRPVYDAPVVRQQRERRSQSPESLQPLPPAQRISWKERNEMIQAAARLNEEDPEERQRRLDAEIGETPDESDSQYMVSKKKRPFEAEGSMPAPAFKRNTESLQKWVSDEAGRNRPAGGFSGSGVAVINNSIPRADSNKFGSFQNNNRGGAGKNGSGGFGKGRTMGRGGSGILGSKNGSFASS